VNALLYLSLFFTHPSRSATMGLISAGQGIEGSKASSTAVRIAETGGCGSRNARESFNGVFWNCLFTKPALTGIGLVRAIGRAERTISSRTDSLIALRLLYCHRQRETCDLADARVFQSIDQRR
jgi:hypothetical protein